jgi:O-antigen/teichoic acid export membrane protein
MLRSIATTGLTKVYSLGCQLAILLLTAHVLGPEGRGVITTLTAWVGVVAVAAHLSLGQVAQPMLAQRKIGAWVPPIAGTVLALTGATSVLAWLSVGLYAVLFDIPLPTDIPPALLLITLAALPFLIAEHHINALAPVAGVLGAFNKLQIAARTLSLLVVGVALLGFGGGVTAALLGLLAGQALIALGGFLLLVKQGQTQPYYETKTAKTLLRGASQLHITVLGAFVINQLDVLIVSATLSLTETGQYALATQLIAAVYVFANAAATVLYGRLAEIGPDHAWAVQRRLITHTLVLTVAGVVCGTVLAPVVLPLMFGPAFAPTVPIFIGLSFGLVAQVFSILMAPQWITRGLFWQTSVLTLLSGVLSLSLNLYFIPRYGMMGAVYAVLGTQAFGLVVNIIFALWVERHVRRIA